MRKKKHGLKFEWNNKDIVYWFEYILNLFKFINLFLYGKPKVTSNIRCDSYESYVQIKNISRKANLVHVIT